MKLQLIVHTVDCKNPAPVEVGSLSCYLQGFIHPRWCKISAGLHRYQDGRPPRTMMPQHQVMVHGTGLHQRVGLSNVFFFHRFWGIIWTSFGHSFGHDLDMIWTFIWTLIWSSNFNFLGECISQGTALPQSD